MRLLLDHNVDRRFRRHILGHEIATAREMGWETLGNGALLQAAARAGFEAFVSLDKKIEYEQNLRTLPLPVVIIDAPSNALAALVGFAPFLLNLLKAPLDRQLFVIEPGGHVRRLPVLRQ